MKAHRIPTVLLPLALLCLVLAASAALATDEFTDGEVIVRLVPGASIDDFNLRWGTSTLDSYAEGDLYLLLAEGSEGMDNLAHQMGSDPDVLWAEPNYIEDTPEGVRQMVVNAVGGEFVDYEDQEISSRIGIPEAHTVARGAGIRIGILDTGVDPAHEALVGHLDPEGYDFVADDSEPWEEGNGLDDDADGIVDEGYAHGSMVAGIVALVAPDAVILPIRVLDDEGRADAFRIVEGIEYALNHGVDVINCSFGTPGTIESVDLMCQTARAQGVIVVAAAGNRAMENPALFPGIQDDSFMITALDSLDCKADFADWNERVMVSAPGTGVRSAYPGNDWGLGSGCSFATPFVAGEVALVLSVWPELEPRNVEEHVQHGVTPIYEIPENQPYLEKLGSGRLFLPAALEMPSAAPAAPAPAGAAVSARLTARPNPSSGSVRLHLAPLSGDARLTVYDTSGRLVRRAALAPSSPAWDGLDNEGAPVPSGRYHIVVEHGQQKLSGSVLVVR